MTDSLAYSCVFAINFLRDRLFSDKFFSLLRCLFHFFMMFDCPLKSGCKEKRKRGSNWFLYPYQSDKRTKVKSEGRIPAKRLSWIICSDYMYSVRLHTVILYHVGYLTRFAIKANHFENGSYSMLIHSQYSDLSSITYIKYISGS